MKARELHYTPRPAHALLPVRVVDRTMPRINPDDYAAPAWQRKGRPDPMRFRLDDPTLPAFLRKQAQ